MADAASDKPAGDVQKAGSVSRELCYWLLYSVVFALAQLWLVPLGYYLFNKPMTLVALIGNGSLLFFATTIASKTAGEYFKKVKKHHEWASFMCIAVMSLIIVPSVFAFAFETAARAGVMQTEALAPERVTNLSLILAVSGVIFSLAYTLLIRAYGD